MKALGQRLGTFRRFSKVFFSCPQGPGWEVWGQRLAWAASCASFWMLVSSSCCASPWMTGWMGVLPCCQGSWSSSGGPQMRGLTCQAASWSLLPLLGLPSPTTCFLTQSLHTSFHTPTLLSGALDNLLLVPRSTDIRSDAQPGGQGGRTKDEEPPAEKAKNQEF